MTVDALLAIAHHLAVFTLVGTLVAELVILRGRMDGPEIARFSRVDGLYGLAAVSVVVVGIARLLFGAVPAEVYLSNAFFWIKMSSLDAVALISIVPTIRGMAWRRALAADPAFVAPVGELARVRRSLSMELAILPLIPASAALMARGIGSF